MTASRCYKKRAGHLHDRVFEPHRPVVAAAAELVRLVLIAGAVILGLALAAGTVLVVCRARHRQAHGRPAAPVLPPARSWPSQALPAPQRPAIEAPREVHLHFHGISAADVAAILRQHEGSARHAGGEE